MEILTVILLSIAALCLIHFIIIIAYTSIKGAFAPFWLVFATGFAVLGALTEIFLRLDLVFAVVILMIITAIPFTCFLILLSMVLSRMNAKPRKKADVLIVLGAKVSGRRITKSLRKRLLKAEEYLKAHGDTVAIVSGGQGDGEDISEAEAMKEFLIHKGIVAERIVMEDKSTTTKENLAFSYEIIMTKYGEDVNKMIVTNNFHIFRAERLAKKLGINNISGLAAQSDPILIVNYVFRECAALVKEKMLGNI